MLPPTKTDQTSKPLQGRRPQAEYLVNVVVGVDVTCLEQAEEGIQLSSRATVPPMLQAYAVENGHKMPDGFYAFYGESAEDHLYSQLDYSLREFQSEKPIWDLQTTLHFEWADPENRPKAAAMSWKDPAAIQGAFIRIGRVSAETNDLLRFFAGDRLAVDRLTLEPWRIDSYVAALEVVYGPIRGVLFDAMMIDGSIQTLVKVYDRDLLEDVKIRPLYRMLSAQDPDQPDYFLAPAENWLGWQSGSHHLTEIDVAEIQTYMNSYRHDNASKDGKRTLEVLTLRRKRYLKDEGRFLPREKEIKAIARRRKDATSYHLSRKVETDDLPTTALQDPKPQHAPSIVQ